MADAEQRDDVGVAAGLGEDALARIDQQHGEIGGRGAGRHVAGVLLVAGRVGDDEAALVGGEEAIGDVDGDALLALGVEAVDEQREVDVARRSCRSVREFGTQRRELVLEQQLGIVEQPADQRRLAVVDAAAGEEAQQVLVAAGGEVGGRRPSVSAGAVAIRNSPRASSSSIEPASSWSISRPWRSEVRATSISATIAGERRSASDSIAAVSG